MALLNWSAGGEAFSYLEICNVKNHNQHPGIVPHVRGGTDCPRAYVERFPTSNNFFAETSLAQSYGG